MVMMVKGGILVLKIKATKSFVVVRYLYWFVRLIINFDFILLQNIVQFTLYAFMKGNKPDFHQSMSPDKSRELYQLFVEKMKSNYKHDLVKGLSHFFLISQ